MIFKRNEGCVSTNQRPLAIVGIEINDWREAKGPALSVRSKKAHPREFSALRDSPSSCVFCFFCVYGRGEELGRVREPGMI